MIRITFLFIIFSIATGMFAQEDRWISLFNGQNLDNWTRLNGTAPYSIEGDSVIAGTAVMNTPNTFLATKTEYNDFILEFEVKVDNRLNSGVQIRSQSLPEYMNRRVHGYQIEIDPSDRAFSGGIYDEARRGWLYPVSLNPKGRSAFRPGTWNHFHVEAIGKTIRVWVNGEMVSNLVDDMTSSGFIALQVHSINNKELEHAQVRWKNIRILTDNFTTHRWTADPDVPEVSFLVNELTENEKRKGWRLLWDGKSSAGWRSAKSSDFPQSGWVMQDGIFTIQATDGGEATGPGDIITVEQFSDFELELEFMITEGANSGIKYFVQPELNQGIGSAIGCEYQILDDQRHPDANMGVAGNRKVGALYDLISADNLSVPGRGKQFKGVGNWNKARIISKDGQVEHWLNGEKAVKYNRKSQMFRALVAFSKYKVWPGFGEWPQGHILLQDHGNTVHFRSIKIREF